MRPIQTLALLLSMTVLAGCAGDDMLDETGGLKVVRSACPAVAIPAHTGDVTLFDPPGSLDSRAIDVVATITNVRTTCAHQGAEIVATTSFDVVGQRRDGASARSVVLPYFATVMRAGTRIVSKDVSQIGLEFKPGETRGSARGMATSRISVAEATIPAAIEARINRKRKAGDEDAAVDPMADPEVKAAVANASFELLVGFQLSPEQLKYNVTR